MLTRWGRMLDRAVPLPEYPRPQLERESYINLNGSWEYAFTVGDMAPEKYEGIITVPFSPESELSGVGRSLSPDEYLWYRRRITLPEGFNEGRVLLHFGAVDQCAVVYLNGVEIGSHTGGYTAFTFDITEQLSSENELVVRVQDLSDSSYHSRGKQKTKRGGIWYTAQSGIWQTVWLESVPEKYITGLKIVPLFDDCAVAITVSASCSCADKCLISLCGKSFEADIGVPFVMPMLSFTPWTPENPHLYFFDVSFGADIVHSYFGMRKFSVERDLAGVPRLFLNGKPYFHHGLLDQGYYSDGLYTPPSDEAMIFDIENAKAMGFNMLRKHIKIEPMRWYYHCDRLGMLVWQDMINGGGQYNFFTISTPLVTGIHFNDRRYRLFARKCEEGRRQYYLELEEMIRQLFNVPSIAVWVPFNEGWGQFDAREAVGRIQALDRTRTIDHASGWHDQKIGELKSLHVYFREYRFKKDKLGRAVVLSEFGGYNLRLEGHCFNKKNFGYKRFKSTGELLSAFTELYERQIIPAKKAGLAASVYTQLTDVEDEVNGLITYDREKIKLPAEELAAIGAKLRG
ncbi:MAG: glycoside hydrolase family 2 protein [Oscillospiraceae bacterium]|nr:glycoside hydrolase family 2 [Oscillospiraceae bacterium]